MKVILQFYSYFLQNIAISQLVMHRICNAHAQKPRSLSRTLSLKNTGIQPEVSLLESATATKLDKNH